MEHSQRILIIEDNPADARLIEMMLTENSDTVDLIRRERLADGLEAIRDHPPDAVLLDLGLPDSNGPETYLAVRDAAPALPVIILTGLDDERVGMEIVQSGAQDYLIKGQIDISHLERAIRYAIGRKRAESALQASEKKYRELVEHANSTILKMDLEGNITFFNEFAEHFFGFSEKEVLGRNVRGTIVPEVESTGRDLKTLVRNICADPDQFTNHENENITKDGRHVWLHWTNRMIVDEQGRPEGILCVGNDITERRIAQEALREREETLRAFMNAITDPAFLIDTEGIVLLSNASAPRSVGRSSKSFIGKPLYEFLPPNTFTSRWVHIDEVVKEKKPLQFEDNRDGRDFRTHIYPVMGTQGDVEKLAIICFDISDAKQMEAKLRNRNKQLSIINRIIRLANSSLILEEMLEIVMNMTLDLMDFDMGCIYIRDKDNRRADLTVATGVPEYYIERHKKVNIRDYPYNVTFYAGQPRYIENTPGNQPGPIDTALLEDMGALSYLTVPLMADSVVLGALNFARAEQCGFAEWEKVIIESIGKEIGGTILRGMLQDQLEEAYEEANVYIDIMTTDICRKNEELLAELEVVRQMLSGQARNYVKKIETIVHQSDEIISNVTTLRTIGDREPGASRECDLDGVIAHAQTKFPHANIAYRPTGLQVMADDLLPEIFYNLISNSLRFGGSQVDIRITAEPHDGMVRVSVEDNGPGIPDDEKQRIFSFSRPESAERRARGPGLYITRKLVEHYGGDIRVEDRVPGISGGGIAVRFTLICGEKAPN